MYRAIIYCIAVNFALAASAFGGFTSPPWPSTNSAYSAGTNKDVRLWQVYSSIVERSEAVGVSYDEPQFYIYERAECIRFKRWVTNYCTRFVNNSYTNGFNTWFTNNSGFPTWSVTAIVSHLNLPTNYFTQTPWQQLSGSGWPVTSSWTHSSGTNSFSELDYGWKYFTNIMALLVWTTEDANWYDGEAGTNTSCGSECFLPLIWHVIDNAPDEGFWGIDYAPVPTAMCSIELGGPAELDYSGVLEGMYEVAGVGVIYGWNQGSTLPCGPPPGYTNSWILETRTGTNFVNGRWSGRETQTTWLEDEGYAVAHTRKGAHLSNVAVTIDFYGYEGEWDNPCFDAPSNASPYLYETIGPFIGGNLSDTGGAVYAAFGWSTNEFNFYVGQVLFPELPREQPQYDNDCLGANNDWVVDGSQGDLGEDNPCFFEFMQEIVDNCENYSSVSDLTNTLYTVAGTWDGWDSYTGGADTRRESGARALIKWDFNY